MQQWAPRAGYVALNRARLFYRDVGQGRPVIVVHGGPSFDHTYLLPEMDLLADTCRLIYYDQRGRGKSTDNVQPDDVSIASDVADLDAVREHFQLDMATLLGHSWGGLLALEYAIRHPECVAQLILMNTAPGSAQDWNVMQGELRAVRRRDEQQEMEALSSTAGFRDCDPDVLAAYYRIYFRPALARSDDLDRLVERLRASFTEPGILTADRVGDRLFDQTLLSAGYDLTPKLKGLRIPTLVIHADHDFIPLDCAVHVAQAVPGARLVVLRDCGHFSYMEAPEAVRDEIVAFVGGAAPSSNSLSLTP